jgi:hypothetical protein
MGTFSGPARPAVAWDEGLEFYFVRQNLLYVGAIE